MGCLLALLAAFAPRLVLFLIWIFTDLVDRAFNGFLLPLLGLLFLPFTTLMFVLWYQPARDGLPAIGWVFVILGVFFDLGSYGKGYRDRDKMRRQA